MRAHLSTIDRCLLIGMLCIPGVVVSSGADPVDFNREVRPLLNRRCVSCHGGVKSSGGLNLLFRSEAVKPARSGRLPLVPGRPADSEVLTRITHSDPDERMPPDGEALSAPEVDLLQRWISEGAPWADHWAYRAPRLHPLPEVNDPDWSRNGIDSFILAGLEKAGLAPAPEADRATLLRRLSMDLTGLPPSPQEIAIFEQDVSIQAYEKQVDRLLESPHYGERWAAMWMDLARYADTKGYEKDAGRTIWRYRDWLIEAFERDLPFDRFTVEQLAGDLLPEATVEQRIATAFHRNTMTNDEGGTDDEEFRVAAVIDRVNTTWEVWMGTTFSCVQCHGHPYDPFRHEDYYRFMAFFNSTEDADQPNERPTLASYSPKQRDRSELLNLRMTALAYEVEQTLSIPSEAAAWQAWLQAAASVADSFPVLQPVQAVAASEAELQIESNGVIMVSGARSARDTYTVHLQPGTDQLTALALETLPHATLPNGGAGRAQDGNFVLSSLGLTIRTPGETTRPGRYVRIELPGKKRLLHLAEVEAFGASGRLPAIGAKQSSTDYEGAAGRATDGNTSGDFEQSSVSHTAEQDDPWWEMDLGAEQAVERIVVWNRTDGEQARRLAGAVVSLLDTGRRVTWQQMLRQAPDGRVSLSLDHQEVFFARVEADFSQRDFPVAHALENPDPAVHGWAVSPDMAKRHQAVWYPPQPLRLPAGARWEIRLGHQFEQEYFTLGRFRIRASDNVHTAALPAVPSELRAAAGRDPAQWTPDETRQLLRWFAAGRPAGRALSDWWSEVDAERAAIKPVSTPVMQERGADQLRTTRVFNRGNWLDPGEVVERGVPASLPPLPEGISPDRLAVARWLVDPAHPLTARVAVNRFWEQLFGTGMVLTAEDFGTQGDPPSHPALLDWLAYRFVHEQGWSVKTLLKEIVLSATYRQAAQSTPDKLAADPYNRLISRGARFRLSAEQIRDSALAVSGLLHPARFGPSVMPPQPEGIWMTVYNARQWVDATGPDRYRRALYTYWKRTSPYPSMITFDTPSREVCVSRRIRTNTPLQALITLNDPVYVEAAEAMAARMMQEGGGELSERIVYGFRLVQGRAPGPEDVTAMAGLYETALADMREQEQPDPESRALAVVASALLNLDRFLSRE